MLEARLREPRVGGEVEVREDDLSRPESLDLRRLMSVPLEVGRMDSLVNAFRGSQAAFLMTPPIALPLALTTALFLVTRMPTPVTTVA